MRGGGRTARDRRRCHLSPRIILGRGDVTISSFHATDRQTERARSAYDGRTDDEGGSSRSLTLYRYIESYSFIPHFKYGNWIERAGGSEGLFIGGARVPRSPPFDSVEFSARPTQRNQAPPAAPPLARTTNEQLRPTQTLSAKKRMELPAAAAADERALDSLSPFLTGWSDGKSGHDQNRATARTTETRSLLIEKNSFHVISDTEMICLQFTHDTKRSCDTVVDGDINETSTFRTEDGGKER